ncbi:MAG: hypothetical protein IT452_19450 [Planctomycetia bacterium]|nr:hypothetical protein [Planctomycetia bacterium]
MKPNRVAVAIALLLVSGCASDPQEPEKPAAPVEARRDPAAHRTRVLYVDGAPRWEFRYLHNVMIRDGNLDVQCWLTTADPAWTQPHSLRSDDDAFSRPLPALPATVEELCFYDVVVLGDVDPASWPGGAKLLAEFVEGGGGLVLIAGQDRMPGAWLDSELAPAIPVRPAEEGLEEEEIPCRLTDAGARSPLVRAMPFAKALPALHWRLATRPAAGATVLVEGGGAPVFATSRYGKGRVFFSATDETWRWRFQSGDEPHYHPFWRRVVEWARDGS